MAEGQKGAARTALHVPCALAVVLGGIALVFAEPAWGWALIGIGSLWFAGYVAVRFFGDHLPSLSAGREPDGSLTLHAHPPNGGRRKRLRREALSLSADMFEFLSTYQSPYQQTLFSPLAVSEHSTEAERNAAFEERNQRFMEGGEQDRLALSTRFAGRVGFVLDGFEEMGLLTGQTSRVHLTFLLGSVHFARELAGEIDRLGRKIGK